MKCTHCGENINSNMVFCSRCGYPVPTDAPTTAFNDENKGEQPLNKDESAGNNREMTPDKTVYSSMNVQGNEAGAGGAPQNNQNIYSNSPKNKKSKLPVIIIIILILIATVLGVCFALGVFDSSSSSNNDKNKSSKSTEASKTESALASDISDVASNDESNDESNAFLDDESQILSGDVNDESQNSNSSVDDTSYFVSEDASTENSVDVSQSDSDVGKNIEDKFKSLASYKALETIDASNGFVVAIGYEVNGYSYWNISAFKDGRRFVEIYYKTNEEEFYGTYLYKDGYYYAFDDENLTYTKEVAVGYWDVRHPVEFFFLNAQYVETFSTEYNGKNYTVDSVIQSGTNMKLYVDEYGDLEYGESAGIFMDVLISEDVSGFNFDVPWGYTAA